MSQVQKICQGMAAIIVTSSLLSGCSQVVKSGANIALGFSEKHIVPPILAMDDADMACNSGNALTPAIMSTKDMGADPTRIAVLLYASSGICAENQALEAELHYLRASKAGQVSEAQDARIQQKRWAAIAAQRQYAGYQLLEKRWATKYNKALGDGCPRMKSDLDQTVYLMGMISGLQAMTNDINSGGAARAVIWTLLPGAGDGKPDPYQTLKQSVQLGEQKGVRLSHALYAVAAQASGDDAKIRDALKAFATARSEEKPVNPQFRLVDSMAQNMVQGISDRYWTEHTGIRSSDDGMQRFWDDQDSSAELDDLFTENETAASS